MSAPTMCGGHSNAKPADARINSLVQPMLPQIKKALGNAANVVVVDYTTQVVAGTNYTVHGTADGRKFRASIFEPLPHTGMPADLKTCAFE